MAHYSYTSYDLITDDDLFYLVVVLYGNDFRSGFEMDQNIDAFFFVNNTLLKCCKSSDTFSQL